MHPHVVNNCIKRHIQIPTYSQSTENVMINEYAQGTPMYQYPYMQASQPMMYGPNQYQGNVGVEGFSQQTNPYMQSPFQNMANSMNPFNN